MLIAVKHSYFLCVCIYTYICLHVCIDVMLEQSAIILHPSIFEVLSGPSNFLNSAWVTVNNPVRSGFLLSHML